MRKCLTLAVLLGCLLPIFTGSCQERRPAKDTGNTEQRFKAMDKNGDGRLTSDEMPRHRMFQRADANHDGYVTLAEAETALAERKPKAAVADEEADLADEDSPASVSGQVEANSGKAGLNIPYAKSQGVDPNLLSLDVYPLADKKAGTSPVVVMIHGGGWQRGDKGNADIGPAKARFFNAQGYVYVAINYRLSPAVQHPSHVEDVAKALAWVDDHIADYGGDRGQIYLMGHSAGAHLAALVATDEKRLQAVGKDLSMLKKVILLDSAAFALSEDRTYGPKLVELYENAFGPDRGKWRDASPLDHIAGGKGIPPMLIFSTDRRPSIEHAREFADGLRKAKVPVATVTAKGKDHAALNRTIGQPNDGESKLILKFLQGGSLDDFPGSI